MPVRNAEATWNGNLATGKGSMKLASGLFEGPFSFGTRMEDQLGTNPEELIGAAHAGCFSMALAHGLSKAGHAPREVRTRADVHLDKVGDAFQITRIRLHTEVAVSGLNQEAFLEIAENAKANCPVSKALAGTEIELDAKLMP